MSFLLPTTRKEAEAIIQECEEMLKGNQLCEKKRVIIERTIQEITSLELSTNRLIRKTIQMTKIVLY